jgi:hypothetical protein
VSLGAFFRAIEAGTTAIPSADLAKHLDATELDALRAARLVKDGPPLRTWPCDHRSKRCAREVLASESGKPAAGGARPARSGKPFVAVCEGSCEEEDRCVDVDLDASDLAQAKLDVRQVVSAIRSAYRVEGTAPTWGTSAPIPPDPVCLGEERVESRTRDVFLALRPNRALLAAFLEARERAARGTLVLVPTARALGAEVGTRNAAGAHVEVEVLADAIAVRGGKVTRTSRLRLVEAAPPAPEEPKPLRKPRVHVTGGLAAEIGAATWRDVKITAIDGHTLRIQCGKVTIRRTYIDLGFGGANREPLEKWRLVMAICAGHGSFRWKQFGEFTTAKNAVSVVQRLLKKAFGLPDNPIHRYRGGLAWQAKFFASSEIEEE